MIGLEQAEQCPLGTVDTPCWVMLRSRSSINVLRLTPPVDNGSVAEVADILCVDVDGIDTKLSD